MLFLIIYSAPLHAPTVGSAAGSSNIMSWAKTLQRDGIRLIRQTGDFQLIIGRGICICDRY